MYLFPHQAFLSLVISLYMLNSAHLHILDQTPGSILHEASILNQRI